MLVTTDVINEQPDRSAVIRHHDIRVAVQAGNEAVTVETMTEASTNYGRLVDSGDYTGQEAPAVITMRFILFVMSSSPPH